jgi:hypothetical protein
MMLQALEIIEKSSDFNLVGLKVQPLVATETAAIKPQQHQKLTSQWQLVEGKLVCQWRKGEV